MRTPHHQPVAAPHEPIAPSVTEDAPEAAPVRAAGSIPPVTAPAGDGGAAATASEQAFGGGGGPVGAGGGGGGGDGLPADVRARFERSLGAGLGDVRVHTDAGAASAADGMSARAFAVGNDIYFGAGQYDPHGPGAALLAHEVAHTVQQRGASSHPQRKDGGAVAARSDGPEREADAAAEAMIAGQPAQVTPVAQRGPYADKLDAGPTWQQLLDALNAALRRSDWADVARRLNGFSHDDIKWYLGKYVAGSPGKVAHIREAAIATMPGYSEHVTKALDEYDNNASRAVSELYLAYERAVVAARASGEWKEVADRLNGMGDWDIADRLKKLTWFDYQGIRATGPTPRVAAAIDVADRARVRAVIAAYDRAVASGAWQDACNYLHGMSDDDIHVRLRALPFTALSAMRGFASPRVLPMIAVELASRPAGEQDDTKPRQVDGLVDVEAPLVALPDFSSDTRTTKEAQAAGGEWSGSAALETFVHDLAHQYAVAAAAQQHAKADDATRAAAAATIETDTLRRFRNQWRRVINEYAQVSWFPKFAVVARYWCSDVSQGRLFALDKALGSYALKIADGAVLPEGEVAGAIEPMVKGSGPGVRRIVNDFIRNLPQSPTCGFLNYAGHGGGKLSGQGFSVDLMMDGSNAGRNDEGFTPREAALQMIHNIAKTAEVVGGDWQVCYNDASVAKAARTFYGNRISHVGVNDKDDNPRDKANANGHGTHAPLNLHFHVDIVPLAGAAVHADGGATKEQVGSPVGVTPGDH